MNKSFIIIFIPAVFVAIMYVSLGIYPPRRIEIGLAIIAAALGAYRVRAMMMKRGKADSSKAVSSSASAKP